MDIKYAVGINEYKGMATDELRETFLIDHLFKAGELELLYCEVERAVVGSAVPTSSALDLKTAKELGTDYFCERRELGVLNLGGTGTITVDGESYEIGHLDAFYAGLGSKEISFSSADADAPACFYLVSYPAHTSHPTVKMTQAEVDPVELGSAAGCNERTINKYIHPEGIQSCQLMMGFTRLKEGSVWNTMPAHTHTRRTEVYLYFDINKDDTVFHFMGPGNETRHITVHNRQAVISPMWSIHSGCGTCNYSFVWAMGGDNQRFDDMDFVEIKDLK